MDDDDYEQDAVYESHETYVNDINIKSECPDYDDEYDSYYDDEDTSNVSYSFRPNETVTVDVMLAGNNSVECIQTNHGSDISIPPVIYIINITIIITTKRMSIFIVLDSERSKQSINFIICFFYCEQLITKILIPIITL